MKTPRRSKRKIKVDDALTEIERDRWKCLTCTAPAADGSQYCWSCASYWSDVASGLFQECE